MRGGTLLGFFGLVGITLLSSDGTARGSSGFCGGLLMVSRGLGRGVQGVAAVRAARFDEVLAIGAGRIAGIVLRQCRRRPRPRQQGQQDQ
jgi:hypothetical protein